MLKRGSRHIHGRLPQRFPRCAEAKLKMAGSRSESHLPSKPGTEIRDAPCRCDGSQISQRQAALKILLEVIHRFLHAVRIRQPRFRRPRLYCFHVELLIEQGDEEPQAGENHLRSPRAVRDHLPHERAQNRFNFLTSRNESRAFPAKTHGKPAALPPHFVQIQTHPQVIILRIPSRTRPMLLAGISDIQIAEILLHRLTLSPPRGTAARKIEKLKYRVSVRSAVMALTTERLTAVG